MNRTERFIISLAAALILGLCLTACERVMPEPPQSFQPRSAAELQDYFSTLKYDLDRLDAGVPRLAVKTLPHDFSLIPDLRERRRLFILTLLPLVLISNEEILAERRRAEQLLDQYQFRRELPKRDLRWLQELADKYRLGDLQLDGQEFRRRLLRHVDTLPISLALAQAANESGWGTSRFAREGNNLFGEWTFIKGAGMVPRDRAPGARHEVRLFSDLHASLRAYMLNLNRHRAYSSLRYKREQLRKAGGKVNGPALAPGLKAYSERGSDYVKDIERMIEQNRFTLFADLQLR